MDKPKCAATHHRHPWRWMILLSRFVQSFIVLGAFKAMGVFLPYFVDSFSTSTAAVGLAGSASISAGYIFLSPLAGALVKVWDPRRLAIAGGAVAALTYFLASFSSSVAQLAVWFSLSSCGYVFVNVSALKLLMEYFPDDYGFATCLSLAGGTIGMMLLPPVSEYLVSVYGWRNALGLLGALQFNYIAAAALLRPLSSTAHYQSVNTHCDDKQTASVQTTQLEEGSPPGKKPNLCRRILSDVAEQFDASVLTEPIFVIYQLVFLLTGMLYTIWHLFLIPHGVALGYGEAPSAYLATFGGVGSLIGRISPGVMVDREILKASTLFIISCLVFMTSSLLDPLAVSSYAALATLASVSGTAIGVIWSLAYVMMREVTGDQHFSAYGWLFLSSSIGHFLGGVIAGWIRDVSEDYEPVFLTMGGVSFFIAVTVAYTRCLLPCCETKD